MLHKIPKCGFKIQQPNINFNLLPYSNVHPATVKKQGKAGLSRLTNLSETLSPRKTKYEYESPGIEKPTGKLSK